MSTEVYDLNRIPFASNRKLLIDTNVLIYLQSGKTNNYDKMWELALRQGNSLFVTTLTISEFINRYVRTGYDVYCDEHNFDKSTFEFKRDYQKTQHFLDIYDEVIDTLESEILKKCNVIDFNKKDFEDISSLTQYMNDINDALYLKKAATEDFSIVTHDADFFDVDIPQQIRIYTYNKKY
ncbi:PIN domain-containing protein [Streptococcus suis]|uniref:type II toxin-antitoxin system VapC family toxin n=1 Tax=Streptococcus suis TaxID=1307 RepID=UPI00201B08E9|nr:PIN domain-containing protein [Streptococcus suis]MCL4908919.1 PIN domain-containing protein [Streptococcus suis]